jgi:metal-responsive CopG/Arc/MetJ family transcriptional regulator
MGKQRIHLSVSERLLARLDQLAEKYGLDRSGAASYCFSRVCEEEGIGQAKAPQRAPKRQHS